MVTNFRSGVAFITPLICSGIVLAATDARPLVHGGVEYRAEHQQDGPDAPLKVSVEAIDPRSAAVLWRVPLYEGTSRGAWMKGRRNPRVVTLALFAQGLIATTDDGATFFVDPDTRRAEMVRDLRHAGAACEVHHRPMMGHLVPIHYGLATGRPLDGEQRQKYPGIDRPIEGGCCVMEEKAAIVTYCPDCRR